MGIIKCMSDTAAEQSKHDSVLVTEELFREALAHVLVDDWEKLTKRYGDDIFGFFCLFVEWT